MATNDSRHSDDLAGILQPFLINGELDLSLERRQLFAADIFYRGEMPAGILRPSTAESLAEAVAAVTTAGFAVVPRGGGLSYSGGLVTDQPRTLMIDTGAINHVVVDIAAGRVVVGAGCTWAQLHDHLQPLGLRTLFWGPASGSLSTIGGALSQQAVLFGSGRHGPAGDNVLAMTVVTGDGRLLSTPGPDAPDPSAFFGDCGALGIKVEAVLPLEPIPAEIRYAASRFVSRTDALTAMARISLAGETTDCFLFDRWNCDQRRPKDATGDLYEEPLPGQRLRPSAGFEIHAAFEGSTAAEADVACDAFRTLCAGCGAEALGQGVLPGLRASPFAPPALLVGPNGRRWVPVHFIVPVERLDLMVSAVDACMVRHKDLIRRHDIVWSWSILLIGGGDALLEPALYWRDAHPDQVRAALPPGYLDSRPQHADAPDARAAIATLREALVAAGRPIGARHMQLGRLYPVQAVYSPWTEADLRANKLRFDPHGRMNPGVLNLD